MRVWLQTKKKNLSVEVKNEASAKFKESQEKAKLEEKKDPDNKKLEDGEEEIITTSKNPENQENSDEPVPEEFVRELEQSRVNDMISGIFEKAKYLLQFSVPRVWDQDYKVNEYLMIDPSSGKNEIDMESKSYSFGKKLKSFKKIQSSKGSIKNYEELDTKEIFNSSGSSILAYLQCNLPLEDIKSKMEERYTDALNRYCGLKIMSNLSH